MNQYLSRLTSLERRFVIGVMVVVILVINILFVWPRFKDWDNVKNRMVKAENLLKKYQAEIAQKPEFAAKVKSLEKEGEVVPQDDQVVDFLRIIQNQAVASGVQLIGNTRQPDRTNQYFMERAQALTVLAGEPQMVDFLYQLSAGNSLIRVRDLTLRPDVPRHSLSANIKLVASYQKTQPTRSTSSTTATPPAKSAAPPAKTATSTTKRP
jgi:Tfp pilus assembly protein PilO